MISKKEVQHVAKLARIELEESELERFRVDLNKILGYIEVLKSVDTEGVEPLAQVTALENVFRADEAASPELADDIIQNAPEREGRFIKVKKVF